MVINFLKERPLDINVISVSANVYDLTDRKALVELVLDGQCGRYGLKEVVFIFGFFRLAFFGIEMCEPLDGSVSEQAFSGNPKTA